MSQLFKPITTAKIDWEDASACFDYSHVFIDGNQLIKRWQALPTEHATQFVIAETGFGRGLNFLQVWSLWQQFAPPTATLHFISSEAHPLTYEDLSRLQVFCNPSLNAKQLLASYPILTPGVHLLEFNNGRVKLTLMLGDALTCYDELLVCGDVHLEKTLRETTVDAWFLDVFTPSDSLFSTISMLSQPTTTLVSSATSELIQDCLRCAGFNVQKSEASYPSLIAEYQQPPSVRLNRNTPWHVAAPSHFKSKHALVLGAGLAGCYTANALASRGWSVTLLDREQDVGSGASGNRQAILYPKISSYHSPLNDFMLTSYLYATKAYQALMDKAQMGKLLGMLQLAHHPKACLTQAKLAMWLAHYPTLARLVNSSEASVLAGIALQSGGVFYPQSGWLDTPRLCQFLVHSGINWIPNTTITSIAYEDGEWHANGHHAPVLVIANGYCAADFHQTAHLPLQAVRGQMTHIVSQALSEELRIPLCADGHILPAIEGRHALGATYHPGDADNGCYAADDSENLGILNTLSTELDWSRTIAGHWASVRAATPDYLPLVGPVANAAHFKQCFESLASDANRWIPRSGVYHEGLYVCAGFGSRGLTTIPLCVEWLARTINKEPSGLFRTMAQSFSPARFLRREIIRADGVAILKPA